MAKKKKEVAEVELPQLTETENVTELENTVEEQMESIEPEISVELPELPKEIWVELPKVNVEELLLKHIDEQEGEEVELNGILEKLHSDDDSFIVAKKSHQLLTKMSAEGKINMADFNWRDLGQHYHEANGKAKKYLLSDIKILAKK